MRRLVVGALAAAALIAVAGCGGSDSGSSSGGGTSATSSAANSGINAAQAKKDLDAIIGEPAAYNFPPIPDAVPKGKVITFQTCPVAICTEVGDGVKQAASALGWRVRIVPMDFTPAGYKSAWQSMAQNPGDAVMTTAPVLPDSAVQSSIDKAGVPYVASTSPSGPHGLKIAVMASPRAVQREGTVEANWIIQDAGKPVKTLFVMDPSIASLTSVPTGYQSAMAKNCPKCSTQTLKVSVAKVGPALAQQVVSQLQSNPDVKYVAFGLGDLATGVPAAIKAAGLNVKVVVRAATPPNMQDLKNGALAAAFTSEIYEVGWAAVDKVVRSLTKQPIGDTQPLGKIRQLTAETLPADLTKPYQIPNFEDGFKQAWGLDN
jgi:ribose transport system substrate-binding protein